MTQHINPGTDTTINTVVIDDSYRSKHRQGIESGCIHECVCPDYKASCIDEDFPCSLPCIDRYQDTSTPSQPTEAQQRIDAEHEVIKAAMNWWMMQRPLDWSEEKHLKHPTINIFGNQELALAEAIALLQAGDPK